jgi:predicted DCC family thiol-disulfide oxidoreductase YuxK
MKESRSRERLLLLYDADCNLCLGTVEKLRRVRTNAELVMVALQDAASNQLPAGIKPEELLAELHLMDGSGRLYRGAEAVFRIIRTIPGLAWLAPFYRVPGLGKMADAIYRLIARHRYLLFGRKQDDCSSGACKIHHPNRTVNSTSAGESSSGKGDPS